MKKSSFNTLNTEKFKNIKKKPSNLFEAQVKHSFTKQVKATQPIDENESKEDALSKARDFGDSSPVSFGRTVWLPTQK